MAREPLPRWGNILWWTIVLLSFAFYVFSAIYLKLDFVQSVGYLWYLFQYFFFLWVISGAAIWVIAWKLSHPGKKLPERDVENSDVANLIP
jgi:hypothetical protein